MYACTRAGRNRFRETKHDANSNPVGCVEPRSRCRRRTDRVVRGRRIVVAVERIAGRAVLIVEVDAAVGVAGLGVEQDVVAHRGAGAAADIEVAPGLGAQGVADHVDVVDAFVDRGVAGFGLDPEHGAARLEVVADLGAVENSVRALVLDVGGVVDDDALDPDAGEGRGFLSHCRGDERAGEKRRQQILTHGITPYTSFDGPPVDGSLIGHASHACLWERLH